MVEPVAKGRKTPAKNKDDWRVVGRDNWQFRRVVVFLSLLFSAGIILWIVISGTDSTLYREIAVAMIAADVAIIGSYVFGAVWDDKSKRRDWRGPRPPIEEEGGP
jgi:hypothetical protein